MTYSSSRLMAIGLLSAGLSLPALADEGPGAQDAGRTGFYVTAIGGYGSMDIEADGTIGAPDGVAFDLDTDLNSGGVYGGSFGYRFDSSGNAIRLEGEAAYRTNDIRRAFASVGGQESAAEEIDSLEGRAVDSLTVMLNGWYDFNNVAFPLKPFVGAGVGGVLSSSVSPFDSRGDDVFGLAYQLGGGVRYPFFSSWSLDLHYRHFRTEASEDIVDGEPGGLGRFTIDRSSSSHQVMLGLTVPLSGRGRPGRHGAARGTSADTPDRRGEVTDGTNAATESQSTPSKRSKLAAAPYPEHGEFESYRLAPGYEPAPSAESPARPPAEQEPAERAMSLDDIMVMQNARPATPAARPRKQPQAGETTAPSRHRTHVPKEQPAAKPAHPSSDGRGVWVQVGTVADVGRANRLWREVWSKDRTRLKGFQPRILRTRTAKGQVLYRVQIGPMPANSAKALCAKLVSECFVTGN